MRFLFVVVAPFLAASLLFSATKRYEVKSGSVTYKSTTQGNTLGMETKGSGEKVMHFKEWGNLEIADETTSTTMPMQGTKTSRNMTKFDHGTVLSVDFESQSIIKTDSLAGLQSLGNNKKSLTQSGREFLEQNGGKKVGNESILGYDCEVWQWKYGKIWVHKGVTLKNEANMLGIKTITVATSAKFGSTPSDSLFKLPNFPVKTMEELMQEQSGGMQQDYQQEAPSEQEIQNMQKQMQDLMKMMGQQPVQ